MSRLRIERKGLLTGASPKAESPNIVSHKAESSIPLLALSYCAAAFSVPNEVQR